MKLQTNTSSDKVVVATLVVLLSLLGILLSYWYGLGWFFLFQTIREFLFAIPQFYLPLIRIAAGQKFAEEESSRIRKNQLFISPALARRALFSLGITILIFWKANIPLYKIVELINH
jgi:hypothetical protein